MSTAHDKRHKQLIDRLRAAREEAGLTQVEMARRLGVSQSMISKLENHERRLDIIELWDWLAVLEIELGVFLQKLGWIRSAVSDKNPVQGIAMPRRGCVEATRNGVNLRLESQGTVRDVTLHGISVEQYLDVESYVVDLFQGLNSESSIPNRQAIFLALRYAIAAMPLANPSDVYHHIIYRIYMREYKRSKTEQSWARAGGEAMELFVEDWYRDALAQYGIKIKALITSTAKRGALQEMGLDSTVGNSKLDIALYGKKGDGFVIFGGVHCKASLAERVSDDVPCSEAMMQRGFVSYLYTFDAKSFPPPAGDLVNYGELGTENSSSDKRRYVEEHGSFDACFAYNTRAAASPTPTPSGKYIYVSGMSPDVDQFPAQVAMAWQRFSSK